jgi:hypothetical protein
MRLVILIASLLILAKPSTSSALDPPGSSCDDLGALAADPLRQSEPVRFEDIQAKRLIKRLPRRHLISNKTTRPSALLFATWPWSIARW